jgi:hypothetical protein
MANSRKERRSFSSKWPSPADQELFVPACSIGTMSPAHCFPQRGGRKGIERSLTTLGVKVLPSSDNNSGQASRMRRTILSYVHRKTNCEPLAASTCWYNRRVHICASRILIVQSFCSRFGVFHISDVFAAWSTSDFAAWRTSKELRGWTVNRSLSVGVTQDRMTGLLTVRPVLETVPTAQSVQNIGSGAEDVAQVPAEQRL